MVSCRRPRRTVSVALATVLGVLLLLSAGLLPGLTPRASAAAPTTGTVRQGEQQTVTGSGFDPGLPTWQLLALGGLLVVLGLWLRAVARRSSDLGRQVQRRAGD